ncbi:hypothetical protein ABW20_dc0100370 [Dactylellina cionopaga]|nr:hypothetical protein ABW20_dc0100370 [Dactylellina cionopaga]
MVMASSSTTPASPFSPFQPLKAISSPQQRSPLRSPAVFNTAQNHTDLVPKFKSRASTLAVLNTKFTTYLQSIQLLQSHGNALTDVESSKLRQNLVKADKLANSYWSLLRDITTSIRLLYLNGQDPESTLVLGYSSVKIVIQCPYCDDLHEHRRVPDADIGVPVVYPAGCGAFGRYRVVFPGDIDKLTGGLGKEAIGIQIHSSAAYWMTVKDDMQDLESFFVVKYRPKSGQQLRPKSIVVTQEVKIEVKVEVREDKEAIKDEERLLFEAFQRLDIAEHRSYDPIPVPPTRHLTTIKKLQEIARSSVEGLNNLDKIVGYHSVPTYRVKAERWKDMEVQKDTRRKVEREMDFQTCTVIEGDSTRLIGLVKSDDFRTVCSCLRGSNHSDIAMVSGLVEDERLDEYFQSSKNRLSNKQLRLLVQELAKEIGHEFPQEIPQAAVHWKRELERKNHSATSAMYWHACHAEKKMLVQFLLMTTTWTPEAISHNIFKNRHLLGKEAGVRTAACLAKDTKFWVSYDICEDCERFIAGVGKKFGMYLSFQRMEEDTRKLEPSVDTEGEATDLEEKESSKR